jgi:hypothetical protein
VQRSLFGRVAHLLGRAKPGFDLREYH